MTVTRKQGKNGTNRFHIIDDNAFIKYQIYNHLNKKEFVYHEFKYK